MHGDPMASPESPAAQTRAWAFIRVTTLQPRQPEELLSAGAARQSEQPPHVVRQTGHSVREFAERHPVVACVERVGVAVGHQHALDEHTHRRRVLDGEHLSDRGAETQ